MRTTSRLPDTAYPPQVVTEDDLDFSSSGSSPHGRPQHRIPNAGVMKEGRCVRALLQSHIAQAAQSETPGRSGPAGPDDGDSADTESGRIRATPSNNFGAEKDVEARMFALLEAPILQTPAPSLSPRCARTKPTTFAIRWCVGRWGLRHVRRRRLRAAPQFPPRVGPAPRVGNLALVAGRPAKGED